MAGPVQPKLAGSKTIQHIPICYQNPIFFHMGKLFSTCDILHILNLIVQIIINTRLWLKP